METTLLKQYINQTRSNGEGYSARLMRFSLECGVSMPTLWKASRGEPVSRKVAQRLFTATGGEVPAEALVFPATAPGKPAAKNGAEK